MKTYCHASLRRMIPMTIYWVSCLSFCLLLSTGSSWAQLQGYYTIGTNGDYPDFSSAVAALEALGISDDVTFKVQAGTYLERVVINHIPGSSCDATVTFKGDAPVEEVVLREAGSKGTPAALQINGVDGIRINGLSIISENFAIDITQGTDCFVLENSVLKYDDGFNNKYLVRSFSTEAASNNHHIYRNNTFVGADFAIYKNYANVFQLPDHIADESIIIENNQFYNQTVYAVRLYRQGDFSITNNTIYNSRNGIRLDHSWYGREISDNQFNASLTRSVSGLQLFNSAANRIERNFFNFKAGGSGILIIPGKTYEQEMLLANNLMSIEGFDISQNFGESILGIEIRKNIVNPDDGKIMLYHNTILLDGQNTSGVTAFRSSNDHNQLFMYNNNISSDVGGTLLDIEDPTVIAEMDHNNLRLSGSTTFAQYGEQEVNSLAEWQQISGLDEYSISVFPGTVYQPSSALVAEGTYLPTVPEDFFSENRSEPPTIGAVDGNIRPALKGDYRVGEAEDFESLAAAVEALERFGAEDSLVLKVQAGSYPEQIMLDGSYGARSITIEGVENDSTAVVIGGQGAIDAVVIRNSSTRLSLRNLSIRGMYLRNVSNLLVENNVIEGGISSYAVREEETNNNLVFHRNRFLGKGITLDRQSARDIYGRSVRKGSVEVGCNTFEEVEERAISIRLYNGISIKGNDINVQAVRTAIGIYLANNLNIREVSHNELYIDGAVADNQPSIGINVIVDPDLPEQVIGNKIIMPEGGIGIEYEYGASGSSLIANNQVIVNAEHREQNMGISLSKGNITLLYNSILIYGQDTTSRAFDFPDDDYNYFLLQNNILANMAGGFAIYSDVYDNQRSYITRYSHNNLYSNGQYLAQLQNDVYENLSEWQSVFTNDAASIAADPRFLARDKLIPVNTALKGAGLSSERINTDYLGRERQQPPTIGAIELLDDNGNILPITDAGEDIKVSLPRESLLLRGKSTDPDGRLLAYQWEKISGPDVTLSQANTANLKLTDLEIGEYIFRFTATDNQGGSSSDELMLTIEGDAPLKPLLSVDAGEDRVLDIPSDVYLLSVKSVKTEARILSYQWEKLSGPSVALMQANTANLKLDNISPGDYSFRFTATAEGGLSASDEVNITFTGGEAENQPPTADAGLDRTVSLPLEQLILSGSGSDPDGNFRAFRWEKISGPDVNMAQANTANLRLSELQAGSYVFRFTVTDNDGAMDADEMQLRIEEPNQPPTADAGLDRTVSLPLEQLILSGSGSDPDGNFRAFQWEKISGPNVNIAQANTANLRLSELQAGSYVFRFTVTDNDGAMDADEMQLRVLEAAPMASARKLKAKAYPNHFRDHVNLEISSHEAASYRVEVYDALGRRYYQGEIHLRPFALFKSERINLEGQALKQGVYFIGISNAKVSKVLKILKTE